MTRKRQGKYSSSQLIEMDAVEVYKLLLKGDIERFPRGFWQRPEALDNAKRCMEYMLNVLLNWKYEDVCNKMGKDVLYEYKLGGMLLTVFKKNKEGVIYNVVKLIYPDLKPWDLKRCGCDYWNKERSAEAIRWLFDEYLKFSKEDIIEKVNVKLIENAVGMALVPFNRNLFKTMDNAYPNVFKEWDFKLGSHEEFWDEEKAVLSTKHLIEETLGLDIKKDRRKIARLSRKTFIKAGLQTPMVKFGGASKLVNMAYPNTFKVWESIVPIEYWNEETIAEAVKWLVIEMLKVEPSKETLNKITNNDFNKMGLSTLTSRYRKEDMFKWTFPELYQ